MAATPAFAVAVAYHSGFDVDCTKTFGTKDVTLVVPDMPALFHAYLDQDESFFDLMKHMTLVSGMDNRDASLIDYLNFAAYQYGEHKILYDADKLIRMATLAGFSQAAKSAYQDGMDSSALVRRRYSLYVEALK